MESEKYKGQRNIDISLPFSLSAVSTMWVASEIVVLTFLRLLRGVEERLSAFFSK